MVQPKSGEQIKCSMAGDLVVHLRFSQAAIKRLAIWLLGGRYHHFLDFNGLGTMQTMLSSFLWRFRRPGHEESSLA